MTIDRVTDSAKPDTAAVAFDELCGSLAARDLAGLWSRPNMPRSPVPRTRPHLWKWHTVKQLAVEAGTIVQVEDDADARRALQFCNPGLPLGTTESLFGAYQYLAPGETAPAHRHTPAAIRFVLEGLNVYTTVNGDACEMEPGDLVLTPSWAWHDHTNYGADPIIWFDAIDVPLIAALDSVFFEEHPTGMQEVRGHGISESRFGALGLREAGTRTTTPHSPLMRYPYADTDRTLRALHEASGDTQITVEYTDPLTGRPAVPTITCQLTRVHASEPGPAHRQTGGRIFVVFRGSGRSVIGDTEFEWSAGDAFVVPSWTTVQHQADETADLFVTSNQAVLEALHLFRSESGLEAPRAETTFRPRLLPEPAGDH